MARWYDYIDIKFIWQLLFCSVFIASYRLESNDGQQTYEQLTTQNCIIPKLTFIWSVKTKVNLFSKRWNIEKYQRQKTNSEKNGSKTPTRQRRIDSFTSFPLKWRHVGDVCVLRLRLDSFAGKPERCVCIFRRFKISWVDRCTVTRHHLHDIWVIFLFVLECYENKIFKLHRYINVYWFSPISRNYKFKCPF